MLRAIFLTMLLFGPVLSGFGQKYAIIPQARLDSLRNPSTVSGGEVMRFDTCRIDVGTICEDDAPSSYLFRWTNCSRNPMVVTKVQTSCGCATALYDKRPVLADQRGEIRITYNPKGHSGVLSRKIFVYTQLSSNEPTAILELSGNVLPSVLPTHDYPYACGPLRLKQQEVRMSGNRRQAERIECLNAGDEPLTVAADSLLLPAYIAFECEPAEVPSGGTADLVIRFDPSKVSAALPDRVPLLLDGIDLSPGMRMIYVRFGDDD